MTRRPGICERGPIFKPGTLTERRNRFRLRNCVTSWGPDRKGCESIQEYLESLMSPSMMAANTTKGLHKLSKAEQEEAKKPNAGKHMQNAAGYALRLIGKDGVPAPKRRRTKKPQKLASILPKPRTPRPRVAHAPETSADAVCNPNLDPRLVDLNGYGPLPFGCATGPLGPIDNQHMVSLVGASPNLPVEVAATSNGNIFGSSSITYHQLASAFVPSMSTYDEESTLGEQELNPCEDLIDWDGGESDECMEWMT